MGSSIGLRFGHDYIRAPRTIAKPQAACRELCGCNNSRHAIFGARTGEAGQRTGAYAKRSSAARSGAARWPRDEYLRNMQDARLFDDGTARWVEVCYCNMPLEEERPYWEEFFDLVKVQDAHARTNCRDENGTEPWACGECDCTERLEARLAEQAPAFLPILKEQAES